MQELRLYISPFIQNMWGVYISWISPAGSILNPAGKHLKMKMFVYWEKKQM